MNIEVLYIWDCPSCKPTLQNIARVITEEGIIATVTPVEIENAAVKGFRGSPTVLIDGKDLEESIIPVAPSGLACRTYVIGGVATGFPPCSLIRRAIQRAIHGAL
jgi:hypothetical protein